MDININAFSALNTIKMNNRRIKSNQSVQSLSFQSNPSCRTLRNAAYAAIAAAAFGLMSCRGTSSSDSKMPQHTYSTEGVEPVEVVKTYDDYVGPKDTLQVGKKVNSDGSVVTVEKDNSSDSDDLIITTERENGEKTVREDFSHDGLCNYNETTFWENGNIKTFKKVLTTVESTLSETEVNKDDVYDFPEPVIVQNKIDEKLYLSYDEDNNLLYWYDTSSHPDILVEEICDSLGRVILRKGYDTETYEYDGYSEEPVRIISERKGCLRIKTYDENKKLKEDYFKSANGTITQATVLDDIVW